MILIQNARIRLRQLVHCASRASAVPHGHNSGDCRRRLTKTRVLYALVCNVQSMREESLLKACPAHPRERSDTLQTKIIDFMH